MIVRILGEGQYELDDRRRSPRSRSSTATRGGPRGRRRAEVPRGARTGCVDKVRTEGTPVAPDRFVPSDLTFPHEDASLAEVRELLASEDVGES